MNKFEKRLVIPKYLCMMLVLALMISCVTTISANASTEDNSIVNVEEARNVAIDFLVGNLKNSDSTTNWKLGVGINEGTALFDLDNNPSAYMFKLSDQQDNDNGYIVISASKNNNPIIEFSCSGKPFTENAIKTTKTIAEKTQLNRKVRKDKTKLYYLGNLEYLAENELDDNTKQTYDISTGDYKPVDINSMKKIKHSENTDAGISNMWKETVKNHSKDSSGSNPPDDNETHITNPSLYETGYTSVTSKDVPSWNRTYFLLDDFGTGGICTPTAATNLCVYWVGVNYDKYSSLYDSKNGWKSAFQSLSSYMGTTPSGTLDSAVATAYVSYFKSKKLSCTAEFTKGTGSGAKIVTEIDNNIPCHLIIHDNNMYGNHSVLALGYKDFVYVGTGFDSTVHNRYIRIADGRTNSATRYIWGDCDGYWNYVSVKPN